MDLPDEPRCPNHPPPQPTLRPLDQCHLAAHPAAQSEHMEAGDVCDRVLAAGRLVCRTGCCVVRKPPHAQCGGHGSRQDSAALSSETLRRLTPSPLFLARRHATPVCVTTRNRTHTAGNTRLPFKPLP